MEHPKNNFRVYIGTYTKRKSEGIYTFLFNTISGEISNIKLAEKIDNPTFLCVSPNGKRLYSTIKVDDFGGVASHLINSKGELEKLNYKIAKGAPPCYVSYSENLNLLFSANYHKGSFCTFKIDSNGEITLPICSITHKGSSINKSHQEKSHLHCCNLSPDNKQVFVSDLGADKVYIYDVTSTSINLNNDIPLFIPKGYGPRHGVFSKNKNIFYLICELSSRILVFNYDNVSFNLIQDISTLPENYINENYAAAIKISKCNNYLYASNRGHNSIACYKINDDGTLSLISHHSTLGDYPRDFEIDPSGKFLIAANQNSDNLTLFKINEDGTLNVVNSNIIIPEPTCVVFKM